MPIYLVTAVFGRALAAVKSMGTNIFSGSDHPETISAIKIKFRTIDYVGEGNRNPYLVTIGLLGASLHMGEM